ncbi:hypothetical protein VaNZ11_004460, partial [Volvox africanus]
MASSSVEPRGPLDTFAEDLGRAVLDAAASGNLSAPALLAAATETGVRPDQLATLIAQTTEIRTQLGNYLLSLLNLLKSTVAVNTNMDNTAGPRVLPLPQARGHDDIPEVMRLSIPVPRLNISLTDKTPGHSIADATRAYVRDAKKYLQAVHGGDNDGIRCLFVGNTLEGAAKDWYRNWTNARGSYTFDELVAALLARFATEVQARDVEARNVLAAGSYHMRRDENVPAYQSRFEALVTPIADLTESERVFWFRRGLTKLLAKWCATDLVGAQIKSYDALVAFAKGAEIRLLAGEEEVKSAPRANA